MYVYQPVFSTGVLLVADKNHSFNIIKCVNPSAEYNNGSGWGLLPEWASVSANTITVSSNAPVTQEGEFNSFRIVCGDSGVNASQNLITLNVVIVGSLTPPVEPPVLVEPPVVVEPPKVIKNGGALFTRKKAVN